MPFYKSPDNKVHCLDSATFEYLLPAGCVQISDSEAAAIQQPSIDQDKFLKWEIIKAERDRRRFNGGVLVAGHWYKSDAIATGEYTALAMISAGTPDNVVLRAAWRTMDGATVDMTPSLARQILAAGFATVAAIDDAAMAHKAALFADPDPANYDFSQGWPAIFEA